MKKEHLFTCRTQDDLSINDPIPNALRLTSALVFDIGHPARKIDAGALSCTRSMPMASKPMDYDEVASDPGSHHASAAIMMWLIACRDCAKEQTAHVVRAEVSLVEATCRLPSGLEGLVRASLEERIRILVERYEATLADRDRVIRRLEDDQRDDSAHVRVLDLESRIADLERRLLELGHPEASERASHRVLEASEAQQSRAIASDVRERMQARIAELENGLRPFAEYSRATDPGDLVEDDVEIAEHVHEGRRSSIRTGWLRAAARLLFTSS